MTTDRGKPSRRIAPLPSPTRGGRPRRHSTPVGIKAVELAVDVLEALAGSVRARGLVELSSEIGMEPSKLHRYLVSLCARGLVKQLPGAGLYDLGPGALSLGMQSLARLDEQSVLRSEADSLGAALGESSFVYVWSQGGPVLIHTCQPAHAMLNIRIGSTVSLFNTAAGPVFCAWLPDSQTRMVMLRDARTLDIDDKAAERLMREELVPPVLRNRVCWSDTSILPNLAACAAPVFDAQGDLFCVIGASLLRHGNTDARRGDVTDAVRLAGGNASRLIGFAPGRARPEA